MLLGLSLLFARGYGPDLTQLVTLDARGVSGVQLTTLLTAKTGIRFQTMDEAGRDRFVVHFKDVPLSTALDKIAAAELGEWSPYDNGFRLRRSPKLVADAAAERRQKEIKRYRKALDGFKKQLGETPDFGDDAARDLARQMKRLGAPQSGVVSNDYWERQNKLQRAVPIGRAFMRMLLTFSPEDLADVPTQQRVVFSTNPTAMQHMMPDEAYPALKSMMSEEEIWELAVAKYLPDNSMNWYGMSMNGKARQLANAMIVFTRWDPRSGINAQLILSDQNRRIVLETYLYLQDPFDNSEDLGAPPTKTPPRIPLPALDVELAGMFDWDGPQPAKSPHTLSDAAREFVLNPDKHDPTSTFAADSLIGLATSKNENVAAVVDDRTLSMFANSINAKGLDPTVFRYVGAWSTQKLLEKDGWLVMSELDPTESDEVLVDRNALRDLIGQALTDQRVTLDTAAAFAQTSERFQDDPVPMVFVQKALGATGPCTLQDDPNLLRLYGSLTDAQRREMAHLPLRSLSPDQWKIVGKVVFGLNANLQEENQQPVQPDENGEYFGFWNMIDREPTVALGSGIPADGFVEITSNADKAIIATMQYGEWYQGEQTYDIQSLAYMMQSRDQGDENHWTVLGMRPADRTQINFHFKYTEKLAQSMSIEDVQPKGSKPTSINGLPEETRLALLKALDEAKKQYAEGGGMEFYGGPPRRSGVPR